MHQKWGDNLLKAYPSIQWSLGLCMETCRVLDWVGAMSLVNPVARMGVMIKRSQTCSALDLRSPAFWTSSAVSARICSTFMTPDMASLIWLARSWMAFEPRDSSADMHLRKTVGQIVKNNRGAAIAQWNRLRLPSCRPGFESQASHLRFFFYSICICAIFVMWKERK